MWFFKSWEELLLLLCWIHQQVHLNVSEQLLSNIRLLTIIYTKRGETRLQKGPF